MSTRVIWYLPPNNQMGSAIVWMNDLPGADQGTVPGLPYGMQVVRILQFQLIPMDGRFIVVVLVETEQK